MEKQFEIIRKTRAFLDTLLDGLSAEQLNKVPDGFNNNIVWNFGHVIAAQQGICYRRSGLPLHIDEEQFEQYKPGSKPEGFVEEAEIKRLKESLITTIDQLEEDCKTGRFSAYVPWITRYGVAVDSIEDAIAFIVFHDGLHTGYIMALRHCV